MPWTGRVSIDHFTLGQQTAQTLDAAWGEFRLSEIEVFEIP